MSAAMWGRGIRRRTSVAASPFTERGAERLRIRDFSRNVFGIFLAAAMLAGCGGSQPPIRAPGGDAATYR